MVKLKRVVKSQSLSLVLNNLILVAGRVLTQRADCTSVCVSPPQSTDTLPPPSLSLALPEVSLTAEPQEQA